MKKRRIRGHEVFSNRDERAQRVLNPKDVKNWDQLPKFVQEHIQALHNQYHGDGK